MRLWYPFAKEEEKDHQKKNCGLMEGMVLELFARRGGTLEVESLIRCCGLSCV